MRQDENWSSFRRYSKLAVLACLTLSSGGCTGGGGPSHGTPSDGGQATSDGGQATSDGGQPAAACDGESVGTTTCADPGGFRVCASGQSGAGYGIRIPCAEGNTCADGICSGACVYPEVLFVVDRSSSMAGARWEWLSSTLATFVAEYNPVVSVGLREFPSGGACGASSIEPPQPAAILTLHAPTTDAQTPLGAALADIVPAFGDPNQAQAAILITDGDETCGDADAVVAAAAESAGKGIDTYVIAVSNQANPVLLDAIADAGRTGVAYSANDAVALRAALVDIAARLDTCALPCVPLECEPNQCGPVSDGCGGIVDCGLCVDPLLCGGAGTPGICESCLSGDAAICALDGPILPPHGCGDTRTASSLESLDSCDGFQQLIGADQTWTFIAPASGAYTVTVRSDQSDQWTDPNGQFSSVVLIVRSGTECAEESCLASDYAGPSPPGQFWAEATVEFAAVAGESYYLTVDGNSLLGNPYDIFLN